MSGRRRIGVTVGVCLDCWMMEWEISRNVFKALWAAIAHKYEVKRNGLVTHTLIAQRERFREVGMISTRGRFIGKRFPGGHRFDPRRKRTQFGQWIVDVCDATGLSIPELSSHVGVSPHTLSKWARGERRPPLYAARLIIERIVEAMKDLGYEQLPTPPEQLF